VNETFQHRARPLSARGRNLNNTFTSKEKEVDVSVSDQII